MDCTDGQPQRIARIRRMDRVSNALVRELCEVKNGLDKRIDEGVLKWFGHVGRREKDMIAKRVYAGVCWFSFSG